MVRQQEEQYEQDRLGNTNRKLDTLRAQEGNAGGFDNGEGLTRVTSAETGSAQSVYSAPTHASRAWVTAVWAFNSVGSGLNTFHLVGGTANSGGANGAFSNTTRRSIDIEVASGNTRREPFGSLEFTHDIGVVSEFEGQVGVELIIDHDQEDEPGLSR